MQHTCTLLHFIYMLSMSDSELPITRFPLLMPFSALISFHTPPAPLLIALLLLHNKHLIRSVIKPYIPSAHPHPAETPGKTSLSPHQLCCHLLSMSGNWTLSHHHHRTNLKGNAAPVNANRLPKSAFSSLGKNLREAGRKME